MNFFAPLLICLALLYPLGGMRRWLQQHVFKVGWLLTKNLQTTTILFYALFLPGVLLYEVVFWMAAGILNVRAERAIEWPKATEIAELKLNFIKLGRSTGGLRLTVVSITPFVVAIGIIWLVANNILNVDDAAVTLRAEGLRGLGSALGQIFSAPDVYLWIYILFAIGNTMMPRWEDLKGARVLLVAAGIVLAILFVLGVADDVIANGLLNPLGDALNLLSSVFVVVIGVNVVITAALGGFETVFERITGDSATFQNGKLVAMTRAERLEYERQQQEREAKARRAARERKPALAAGPPSIYRLPLPIPGAPARDAEPAVVTRDEERVLGAGASPPPAAPAPQPRILAPGASLSTSPTSASPPAQPSLFSSPPPPAAASTSSGVSSPPPAPPSGASLFGSPPPPRPALTPTDEDDDEDDLDADETDDEIDEEELDDEDEKLDDEDSDDVDNEEGDDDTDDDNDESET
jgi:hypothetical protein